MKLSPGMIKFLSLMAEGCIAVLGAVMSKLAIDMMRARRLLPHHNEAEDYPVYTTAAPRKRKKREQVSPVVDRVSEAALDVAAPMAADALLEPMEKKMERKIARSTPRAPTDSYSESDISAMLDDAMLRPKRSTTTTRRKRK